MDNTGAFQPPLSINLDCRKEVTKTCIELALAMMSMTTWWSSLSARWAPLQMGSKISQTQTLEFSRWLVGLWPSAREIICKVCNRFWKTSALELAASGDFTPGSSSNQAPRSKG